MGAMFWVGLAVGFYILSGFVSRALGIDVGRSTPGLQGLRARRSRLGR